ncbi:MAG: hypothetical protein HYU85_07210 [Chloroflexi bacterium]|nr:hypothetical protein [Chloroflexota bacterium]MBI3931357.1 hypothetical protein [Chloroflexota bacterium]
MTKRLKNGTYDTKPLESEGVRGYETISEIEDSQTIFYNPTRKVTGKTIAGRTKPAKIQSPGATSHQLSFSDSA